MKNRFLGAALAALRGTSQQFCVNLNGVSVSSGLLHLEIEWTEE